MDGEAEAEGSGKFDPAASAGLFMGISSFEDERIPSVPFAADDAIDLAHLFALELELILPERTVLLLAGEPRKPESAERLKLLLERGARRHGARQRDVYHYLGELARGTEARGIAVFTVATHGVSDQGGDFLVATDSLKERTLRTGVAVAELFDEIARASAARRLVLLDACRERLSQGMRGDDESAMAQSFADAIARTIGMVVLSGATLGGFAYDDLERQNGVFTAAVLDGLRGEAPAGPEGFITVRTLADFVQNRVSVWVRHNRPDHVLKSLGIARRIEATAEALPLAPHPKATRERQRYRARREEALARVKDNQGRVLSGALWDQIASLLPVEVPSPEAERLLEEVEALDGTERAQRSLRDFLRELSGGVSLPTSPRKEEQGKQEEASRAELTRPTERRAEVKQVHVGKPATIKWGKPALGAGVLLVAMLLLSLGKGGVSFIWLIWIGLLAGWLAGQLMKGGYGLIGDLIVGVFGSLLGGWLFGLLGMWPGGGLLGSLTVAFLGACILIFLLRLIRRV